MQSDLAERYPELEMQIIGINEMGHTSGLETANAERTLPLLQDDETQRVWERWSVTYRDVIVLDGENKKVGVLNLTDNSLADEENKVTMEDLFLTAGGIH
jgi:hypothetical protein